MKMIRRLSQTLQNKAHQKGHTKRSDGAEKTQGKKQYSILAREMMSPMARNQNTKKEAKKFHKNKSGTARSLMAKRKPLVPISADKPDEDEHRLILTANMRRQSMANQEQARKRARQIKNDPENQRTGKVTGNEPVTKPTDSNAVIDTPSIISSTKEEQSVRAGPSNKSSAVSAAPPPSLPAATSAQPVEPAPIGAPRTATQPPAHPPLGAPEGSSPRLTTRTEAGTGMAMRIDARAMTRATKALEAAVLAAEASPSKQSTSLSAAGSGPAPAKAPPSPRSVASSAASSLLGSLSGAESTGSGTGAATAMLASLVFLDRPEADEDTNSYIEEDAGESRPELVLREEEQDGDLSEGFVLVDEC